MNWLTTNSHAGLKNRAWSAAIVLVITMMFAAPRNIAQTMQKGISLQLAGTSSAVPVPDADKPDALIITVTDAGKLFFGIDPITSDSLGKKLKDRASYRMVYIKADARAPYASVVKVFDAARTAGVVDVTLLTKEPKTTQAGTVVLPEGIEMELARRSPAATK